MRIVKRQTTFWEIEAEGTVRCLHFSGKREHRYVPGSFVEEGVFDRHPVLAQHHERFTSVYVSTPSGKPSDLIANMKAEVLGISGGWRTVEEYLNPDVVVEKILREGNGLLLRAPSSVAEGLAEILRAHGTRVSLQAHGNAPRGEAKVWIGGDSFVVAERFHWAPL